MSGPATLDYAGYLDLLRRTGPPRMAWIPLAELDEERTGFAVHLAFTAQGLVLVRNRERACWELPGGRKEPGERSLDTARRELAEECGAGPAELRPWCGYEVRLGERVTRGLLCLTFLSELPGPPPESEIAEARVVRRWPGALCYPHIQGRILQQAARRLIARPDVPALPELPNSLLSILIDAPPPLGEIPPPPQNRPA
ncbi:MAG: NUDIX domain-containing protein [Candidatus Delongbacteria bacterium]